MPNVVAALNAVAKDVASVGKAGRNAQQGYDFRGIDDVMNAVGPAFRTHNVLCVPTVEDAHYSSIEVGSKRTLMRECTLRVRYTFYGPEGDSLDTVVYGEAMDAGDKATAKAHSVAYRTALLQALTIPTHEPDPDEASYQRASGTNREDSKPKDAPITESQRKEIVRLSTERFGEQVASVMPSVIEEHVGRQARMAELTKAEASKLLDFLAGPA